MRDNTGGTGTINSGDQVAIIGTADMSSFDYANLNTNNFSIVS